MSEEARRMVAQSRVRVLQRIVNHWMFDIKTLCISPAGVHAVVRTVKFSDCYFTCAWPTANTQYEYQHLRGESYLEIDAVSYHFAVVRQLGEGEHEATLQRGKDWPKEHPHTEAAP